MNRRRAAIIFSLAALAVAIVLIVIFALRSSTVSERELRDTEDIVVQVADSRRTAHSVQVSLSISNHRDRRADSIVLNVQVVDSAGRVLASNPLVNVLSLQPGEKKQLVAPVPLMSATLPPSGWQVQASAILVRWAQ